jgi:hypothetical protein
MGDAVIHVGVELKAGGQLIGSRIPMARAARFAGSPTRPAFDGPANSRLMPARAAPARLRSASESSGEVRIVDTKEEGSGVRVVWMSNINRAELAALQNRGMQRIKRMLATDALAHRASSLDRGAAAAYDMVMVMAFS